MNERIEKLVRASGGIGHDDDGQELTPMLAGSNLEKFAESLIEDVLNEVKERAYYTGDRDWSDDVDRPWIQLEFGYGKLHESKK